MGVEPDFIISPNCTPIPVATHGVILAQQITVCTTCVLSVLGAGLIIFSYVAFKELRTGAREFLVQLSIADICVALSHMLGVLINLPVHTHPCQPPVEQDGTEDTFCKVQAGVTMFGVMACFLWTLAVGIYLLVIVVFERQVVGRRLRSVFYLVCWGIPLVLTTVSGCLGYLGFDQSLDAGWCYTTWINTTNPQRRSIIPQLVGYNIWVYFIFLLLPLLYLWIKCYVRVKLSRVQSKVTLSANLQARSKHSDLKLTFIPVIFLSLRVFGIVLAIPHTYLVYEDRLAFRETWWNAALVLLAGIGSSAQGFMNAILFCAFTKAVRQKLLVFFSHLCTCRQSSNQSKLYRLLTTPTPSAENCEETTQVGYSGSINYSSEKLRNDSLKNPILATSGSINNYLSSANQAVMKQAE